MKNQEEEEEEEEKPTLDLLLYTYIVTDTIFTTPEHKRFCYYLSLYYRGRLGDIQFQYLNRRLIQEIERSKTFFSVIRLIYLLYQDYYQDLEEDQIFFKFLHQLPDSIIMRIPLIAQETIF